MNLIELKRKIILGTVQLGLPYGINNSTGKPEQEEAFLILDKASSEQIYLLDSAETYGNSLEVICNYLKNNDASFQVINKFIVDDVPLEKKVSLMLQKLNGKLPYAYMFHRFSDYLSGKQKDNLLRLQDENKIKKIGVSIYTVDELSIVINDPDISVIQIPFNPFDATKRKIELLTKAKTSGKEIHVRSIFLQGLFFKDPVKLTGNLVDLSAALQFFHQTVKEHGLNIRQACLNFALHQPYIDYVIFGVETVSQLKENMDAIMDRFPEALRQNLYSLPIIDTSLLNPSNWKP